MAAVAQLQSRAVLPASAAGRRHVVAAARSTAQAPSQAPSTTGTRHNNILPAELTEGQRRKLELQAQAAAALAADNAWWQESPDTPANLVTAATPAEFKSLIMGAGPTQLVVVDYLKPGCSACRRLFPKFKQIAASNPQTLFVKVNVETDEMRELGQGMQVTHLPWFHLFLAGELKASFSANLTTVGMLRAEIAAQKPCTDPGCTAY